jgi:hypothetical protein
MMHVKPALTKLMLALTCSGGEQALPRTAIFDHRCIGLRGHGHVHGVFILATYPQGK